MSRGDLGGIGVSEAGDDLGVSPGSTDVLTKVCWVVEGLIGVLGPELLD